MYYALDVLLKKTNGNDYGHCVHIVSRSYINIKEWVKYFISVSRFNKNSNIARQQENGLIAYLIFW